METTFDLVPSDFCLACRGCCRFKEKESLWRPRVGISECATFPVVKSTLDKSLAIKTSFKDGKYLCHFLDDKTNYCRIYDKRPFECRLYPLVLIRKGEEIFLALHLACPFVQESMAALLDPSQAAIWKAWFADEAVTAAIRQDAFLWQDHSHYPEELKLLFPL